jgi:polyisoprenoid-binding protein YceI
LQGARRLNVLRRREDDGVQGEAHEAGLIEGATFGGLQGWHRRVAGPCSRKLSGAVVALLLATAPAFAGDVYLIDGSRSEAKFAIRYLLSTMVGRLRDIGGTIDLDSVNPSASSVKFSMRTASVDTGSAELDQALRSAVFLDAAKFPQITFESAVIETTAKTNVYRVIGELTLHGVTKGVVLSVESGGVVPDRDGRARVAFMVRTTLNRKDYGISWNKALDQGALLVGDDIEITVNLEASRQAPMARSK